MIEIIKMFELHTSMPGMWSTEYQAAIPLKFLIIMHTNQSKSLPGFRVVMTSLGGINGWSIQMLLREENDLKQSDEIQAKFYHGSYNLENILNFTSHLENSLNLV